jgi:transcriptional regulator with XRE-family HTH domain
MGKTRKSLRVLRADYGPRGVTQTQFARLVKVSRLRYWAIENGESEPTEDEKGAIAGAFGVAVSAIEWPAVIRMRRAS